MFFVALIYGQNFSWCFFRMLMQVTRLIWTFFLFYTVLNLSHEAFRFFYRKNSLTFQVPGPINWICQKLLVEKCHPIPILWYSLSWIAAESTQNLESIIYSNSHADSVAIFSVQPPFFTMVWLNIFDLERTAYLISLLTSCPNTAQASQSANELLSELKLI